MRRRVTNFRLFKKSYIVAFFAIGFVCFVALSLWIAYLVVTLPNPQNLASRVVNQSTKIWDRTGKVLLYEIHGEEKRTVISFSDMPQSMKQATLAAEDAEFYNHPAFDIKSIARAILNNVLRCGPIQGGSTITQQLAKNSFLTSEKTIVRKIKELILAIRLEQQYTKDKIFEMYLNQIPYGSNAYGIEAASQSFFEKPAKDLDVAESALLVALANAPSRLSPFGSHTDEMKARQEYILNKMASLGWITKQDAQNAKKEKLAFAKVKQSIKAPHFVFYVRSLLSDMYDEPTIETSGLNIITSLDWDLQQIAERAVAAGAARNDINWHADNAALAAQNPKTGEIVAMAGSRDYFDTDHQGNLNVALQTRQPGSSFKPFVYLKAFEKGYTPETILFDVPTEFNLRCSVDSSPGQGMKPEDCYHPQNYDEQFRGPVTLRQALAQSRNVPSVKLLYLVGISNAIQLAKDFGITTLDQNPMYYGLSLILGGGGVRLIDMVNAYSVFSQEGVVHPQIAILKITDPSGSPVFEAQPQEKRVFDANTVRILTNVLSDDASRVPTFQMNGPLTVPGYDVAAKTGTSQDYRDAWTIGYSPNLVAGVWVGNNDYSPMQRGGAGGMAAAPIWNDFMKQALVKMDKESFTLPEYPATTKPILNGQHIIQTPAGLQIHDTLYWIQKDNPQGPEPTNPYDDPAYSYWEYGLTQWMAQNGQTLVQNQPRQPQTIAPSILFLEPQQNKIIAQGNALSVSVRVSSVMPIKYVDCSFNNEMVIRFDPTPDNIYSVFFVPKAVLQTNIVTVKAVDINGTVTQVTQNVNGM